MDNASIHTSEILKNYTKEQKLNVIYNIPYNPETNPIENVFGWLKNSVKRNKNSTENDIRISIDFERNTGAFYQNANVPFLVKDVQYFSHKFTYCIT